VYKRQLSLDGTGFLIAIVEPL